MQIGKHNRKLVEVRKAFQHGTLTADGLLPVEGPILLEAAERSDIEIVDVFIREGVKVPRVRAAEVHDEIPEDIFKSLPDTEHSQGVVATIRPREFRLDEVFKPEPAMVVVLARLQDPGNAGTILRISESFGATGCVALRGTVSFYNSKAVRASTGSIFRIPHVSTADLQEVVTQLRNRNVAILGTSPAAKMPIDAWDWHKPCAVLIGNEGSGLNAEEMAACDTMLRIPHQHSVESLNSAIAAAVTLYEGSKQRR